ncbi:MAG: hypothetical protein ACI3XC_02030 [Phascolarctobacterium sp.]
MGNSLTKSQFDNIIRENVIKHGGLKYSPFFEAKGEEKAYTNYYNDTAFDDFCDEMKNTYPKAYDAYKNGPGKELDKRPPAPAKMASVASSSRFCYLALRNGAEALGLMGTPEFEKACPIKGLVPQTIANPDAFFEEDNTYFEVKCHEIFDPQKTFKDKYRSLFLNNYKAFGFKKEQFNPMEGPDDFILDILGDKHATIKRFDYKQLICHLMGIASNKDTNKTAALIYLFFKPKSAKYSVELENLFDELSHEIHLVFDNKHIRSFIRKNNIRLKAYAECDYVMKTLSKNNIIELY